VFDQGIVTTYTLLRDKWQDPIVRKNAGSLMLGKMIGSSILPLPTQFRNNSKLFF
jgi:hypothetical protein